MGNKEKSIVAAILLLAGQLVMAQSVDRDLTIEEAYLRDLKQSQTIEEIRKGGGYDNTVMALDVAEAYIAEGNTGKAIGDQMRFIAKEWTNNRVQEAGRVANNYPDLRARAVRLLGEIGTEDARRSVIDVIRYEPEPDVVYESILALTKIGGSHERESIDFATDAYSRFDNAIPDNRIAFALVSMYRSYFKKHGSDTSLLQVVQYLAASPKYNTYVHQVAKSLLSDMLKGASL